MVQRHQGKANMELPAADADAVRGDFARLIGVAEGDLFHFPKMERAGLESTLEDLSLGSKDTATTIPQALDRLNIKLWGAVDVLWLENDKVTRTDAPRAFLANIDDEWREKRDDIAIKDSTGKWVVVIDHHGGVSLKDCSKGTESK